MKLVTTKTFLMDSLSHDNKENIPPIPVHPSQHHHSLSEQHIQVGDYYLSALLGRGNYGEVRLARHVRTHELYAVKILPNDIFGENAYACDVRREMVSSLHKLNKHAHTIESPSPICCQHSLRKLTNRGREHDHSLSY